jgi:ArsR family transcriptional regulator
MQAVSTQTPIEIVSGFHALSEPLRIQVLELLRTQELCVCELCEHLGSRSRNCLSISKT